MGVPCTWFESFDGDRHLVPDLTEITDQFPGYQVSGTHQAYLNLIDGGVDLILAAREPSDDEILHAAKAGVLLETKPVGLDAFVFIVNDDNPVNELTTSQIQEIYTGKLTNWSEVGGNNAQIQPYQRNETSGSQVLMRKLVMGELLMIDAPDMTLPTMMAPFNAVSTDPNGIGYSVYYYEENMAPQQERIKLVAVDGARPDEESIHSRKYPYTTEVYVVIRKDLPQDSVAFQLRNWLLSSSGQELIKESGYVPFN
jgi:phosphate transport system substrate-binding protein